MIRAVIDANVLISGAIVTYGASAFLVDAIKRCQSQEIHYDHQIRH